MTKQNAKNNFFLTFSISTFHLEFFPFKVSILAARILAISITSFRSFSVLTLLLLPESFKRLNQNFVSLADFKA